jgi:pimeloyl-ACP methyl ester carboxylesterase
MVRDPDVRTACETYTDFVHHHLDPRYGGPILTNPGGPGGPGAMVAIALGKTLQTIVDSGVDPRFAPDDARYFDLIGFDPRGIGWSEPMAVCMADKPSMWSWNIREENEGLVGSSDAALGRLWSMTHAFGSSCKLAEEDQDGPDIKQYMSTASVARDMLEIVEKHHALVANQVAHLAAQKAGKRGCHSTTYVPGEAKLQYWGFSYGTYLGSTFASMFPNRVGRLVLDGVVSSYDYNHSLGNGSLTDTEKAMNSFYTFCHHAGPKGCALATANSTLTDIEERSQSIVQSLYHNPVPLVTAEGPEFFTWSELKVIVFSSTYQPRIMFPYVAQILADIEAGGGDVLDQLAMGYRYTHVYSCPVNDSGQPDLRDSGIIATTAILCGDGIDQSHVTRDEFAEYHKFMDAKSPTAGSYWSTLLLRCTAWKIRASHTFQGPFGSNTSHPLLFISNTADPVTPLRSGRFMQNLFPGSGLLISDHAGHCSISAPDPCALAHVRAYFQTGALPSPGTVCVPPPGPFSLNSTDPKSPFYDPSLGSTNVVLDFGDTDVEQQRLLWDLGWQLERDIAESGIFGVQSLPGGGKARMAMQIAANGY